MGYVTKCTKISSATLKWGGKPIFGKIKDYEKGNMATLIDKKQSKNKNSKFLYATW